jgi:hypothetical protein
MLPLFLCDRSVTDFPDSPYSPFFKLNNLGAFGVVGYAHKCCSLSRFYSVSVTIHHPNSE